MLEYEAKLYELSGYATNILPAEEEQVKYFVRGSRTQLQIETWSLVTTSWSFLDTIDHVCTIKQLYLKANRVMISGLYRLDSRDILKGPTWGYNRVSLVVSYSFYYGFLREVANPSILPDRVALFILLGGGQEIKVQ